MPFEDMPRPTPSSSELMIPSCCAPPPHFSGLWYPSTRNYQGNNNVLAEVAHRSPEIVCRTFGGSVSFHFLRKVWALASFAVFSLRCSWIRTEESRMCRRFCTGALRGTKLQSRATICCAGKSIQKQLPIPSGMFYCSRRCQTFDWRLHGLRLRE
ncbi:hypothetical protein C8J57DRAFT_1344160 [Mycena rebaudengoi]|nr:hypothetical protein C8J57DRAFT_1344160 [Mycena rebaudengoi]